MILKKLKKPIILFLLLISIPNVGFAYSDYIIPGGENVGIELNSKGIVVVGTYKIKNENPAKDAGIIKGDIITSIDDENVMNINEMLSKINATTNDTIKIGYIRDDIQKYANLKLYKDNNNFKTGLYVKDSIVGIGTLTFIDPNTKKFGALGHEIIERATGRIFDITKGKIFESLVIGVKPSINGTPGEKNARYYSDRINGLVDENTKSGIFGNYTSVLPQKDLYKVAQKNDVKLGEATIRTVLNENIITEYKINITKINTSSKTKNIMFEITDKELLNKTNGIVQGMSGSPILQGEYIIGAVTHVVIDNPQKGYGIFITSMLEEAEN